MNLPWLPSSHRQAWAACRFRQGSVRSTASPWTFCRQPVSRFASATIQLMSSFDAAAVRKAVEEFTPRRPQKFQDLLPAKEVIVELRQERSLCRSIVDLLLLLYEAFWRESNGTRTGRSGYRDLPRRFADWVIGASITGYFHPAETDPPTRQNPMPDGFCSLPARGVQRQRVATRRPQVPVRRCK